jgi:hypothetical protein
MVGKTVRFSAIFPKDTVRPEADFAVIKLRPLDNCSIASETLKGISPPRLWFPRCDKPRTSAILSSLSAGAVWVDRYGPLRHRTTNLNFL